VAQPFDKLAGVQQKVESKMAESYATLEAEKQLK